MPPTTRTLQLGADQQTISGHGPSTEVSRRPPLICVQKIFFSGSVKTTNVSQGLQWITFIGLKYLGCVTFGNIWTNWYKKNWVWD